MKIVQCGSFNNAYAVLDPDGQQAVRRAQAAISDSHDLESLKLRYLLQFNDPFYTMDVSVVKYCIIFYIEPDNTVLLTDIRPYYT